MAHLGVPTQVMAVRQLPENQGWGQVGPEGLQQVSRWVLRLCSKFQGVLVPEPGLLAVAPFPQNPQLCVQMQICV